MHLKDDQMPKHHTAECKYSDNNLIFHSNHHEVNSKNTAFNRTAYFDVCDWPKQPLAT